MTGDSPLPHPTEWPVVRLGDIAVKIGSGATPRGGEDSYLRSRSRFALVRSQNVYDRRFDRAGLAFITDQQAEGLRSVTLQARDLLLNITGDGVTFSRACVVPEDVLPACVNQHVAIVRLDPASVDPGYVLAFLTHPAVKSYIESFNAGGSRRAITKGHIESFRLALPPLPEQQAIAHILGTLDDKIELNRRMSETQEAIARALFKSWFVDFEPVRAKVGGRDAGLPKPLTDLFPDSLEDSQLGDIPKGWKVGRLGDFLKQRVERCVASEETAARPYVPIDSISSKSLFLMDSKPGDEAQSSLTKFHKGDLLFGAMRPYFHKVCIAPFDGTTRTTVFVLFPKTKEDFAFAALLLHDPDTIDYATRHSTGSTIPYAVWSASLEDMPAIVPSFEVRKAFDGVVNPLLTRSPAPYFQNKTLAEIRATLLPKLFSGELRIGDAERFIGATGP